MATLETIIRAAQPHTYQALLEKREELRKEAVANATPRPVVAREMAATYLASGPATGTVALSGETLGLWFPAANRTVVDSPEAAAQVMMPFFTGTDREYAVAAMLDTKHYLLGVKVVSVGSVDHTFMSPREIFRDALLANASAIIIGHCHPSGSPEPSRDDELVTRRVSAAGEVLGVDVLDSIVVGGTSFTSLARRGLL